MLSRDIFKRASYDLCLNFSDTPEPVYTHNFFQSRPLLRLVFKFRKQKHFVLNINSGRNFFDEQFLYISITVFLSYSMIWNQDVFTEKSSFPSTSTEEDNNDPVSS